MPNADSAETPGAHGRSPTPAGAPADGPSAQTALSDTELAILALERRWWRYQAVKESVIREQFNLSPTRYYLLLNALLDTPAALAADPVTVNRLRRLREERRRQRTRRHRAEDPGADGRLWDEVD